MHKSETTRKRGRDRPVKFDFFRINDVTQQTESLVLTIVARTPSQYTREVITCSNSSSSSSSIQI